MSTGLLLAVFLVAPTLAGDVAYEPAGGTPADPAWSSDGKWLAYEVTRDGGASIDLFVSAVTRGGAAEEGQRVHMPGASARTAIAQDPTWHPAGVLLFSGSVAEGEAHRAWFVAPGRGAASELLDEVRAPGHLMHPVASPDGDHVAWIAHSREGADLWTWNRNTDTYRQLTSTDATEGSLAWSPDSSRIVFERFEGSSSDIVMIDVATGAETSIAATSADESRPRWAGDRVVYFRSANGAWEIVVARAGEPDVRLVEGVALPSRAAAASPDGGWVAWAAGTSRIGLTSLDGEQQILLETGQPGVADPVIAAQGDQLLVAYTWGPADRRRLSVEPISSVMLANASEPGAVVPLAAAMGAGSVTDAVLDEPEAADADGDGILEGEPDGEGASGPAIGGPEGEAPRSSWFGCLGAAPAAKEGSAQATRGAPWPIAALLLGLVLGLILARALRRER